MEERQERPSLLEKLDRIIERGRTILSKPEVKRVSMQSWLHRVRFQLKTLYGHDSQVVKDLQWIIRTKPEKPPQEILKEHVQRIERLLSILRGSWDASNEHDQGRTHGKKIFLGHGKNPVWNRVYTYIKDELKLDVEAFETEPHISSHTLDVLSKFLEECDTAVLVMAGDDYTSEGGLRARQNVIHEIGLFQGKYGVDRVIIFQEAGVEEFTNISGLQTVRYHTRPEEGFYQLQRALQKLMRN